MIRRLHPHPPSTDLPMNRARKRVFAWLAIFAMLAGTLAPALGRATVPGEGARYLADICSVAAAGTFEPDGAGAARSGLRAADRDGDGRLGEHTLERCSYCCSHGGAAIAAAAAAVAQTALVAARQPPRLARSTPRPRGTWLPAQPRAPPPGA